MKATFQRALCPKANLPNLEVVKQIKYTYNESLHMDYIIYNSSIYIEIVGTSKLKMEENILSLRKNCLLKGYIGRISKDRFGSCGAY